MQRKRELRRTADDLCAALQDAQGELRRAYERMAEERQRRQQAEETALDSKRALHVALGLPPVPVVFP